MADGQQMTTQSKYVKKKKPDQQPEIAENEVRIKGNMGHVKRYVDYACSLLEGQRLPDRDQPDESKADKDKEDGDKAENEEEAEKTPKEPLKFDTIVLKATGRAINKAVTTAEVVKRKITGLHQVTSLTTLEIIDVWEPKEQGLKEVETKRRVASITIKLSRNESDVSVDDPGYQQPIANDAIKPFTMSSGNDRPRRQRRGGGYRRGGGGGGGQRGGRGRRNNRNQGYGQGGNRRGGGGYGGGGNRRGGQGRDQYNDRPRRGGQGGGYGGDRRRDNGGRRDRDRDRPGYGGGGRRGGGRGGYGGYGGYGGRGGGRRYDRDRY